MKNKKLNKMILNALILATLSSSSIYPVSFSQRYNRFKMTCAKGYKKTKSWLKGNKEAICAVLGLSAIGGAAWYFNKEKSDRQLSNEIQQDIDNFGPRYYPLVCNFQHQVGNSYDKEILMVDPTLLNIVPSWKNELMRLPQVCNTLRRDASELQNRINRLQAKQKTPAENGLLERMRIQKERIDDLFNRLNNINEFLQDHTNYFYLLENIASIVERYNDINSVESAIRHARVQYPRSLWPIIQYCEQLSHDINNVYATIQKAAGHMKTEEYNQALAWYHALVKIQADLISSPEYEQDLQKKYNYDQEQKRLEIERARVRAQEERTKAEKQRVRLEQERVRAIKEQTRAINRQRREQQKTHQATQGSNNNDDIIDLIHNILDNIDQ